MTMEQEQITLYIDTTERQILIVQALAGQTVVAEIRTDQSRDHAQNLLPTIQKLLSDAGYTLEHLAEVKVNPGPGSFTGTRVGVTVANALGFALNIPVNGQVAGNITPIYDREPNISQPKQK